MEQRKRTLTDKQKFKAFAIFEQNKERFVNMKRSQIYTEAQALLDFEVTKSNVDHLLDVLGIVPERARAISGDDEIKSVLLNIVDLLEEIVCSVSRADIFTGNIHLAPATAKLEQIKKALG